jgi:hypothetical protein
MGCQNCEAIILIVKTMKAFCFECQQSRFLLCCCSVPPRLRVSSLIVHSCPPPPTSSSSVTNLLLSRGHSTNQWRSQDRAPGGSPALLPPPTPPSFVLLLKIKGASQHFRRYPHPHTHLPGLLDPPTSINLKFTPQMKRNANAATTASVRSAWWNLCLVHFVPAPAITTPLVLSLVGGVDEALLLVARDLARSVSWFEPHAASISMPMATPLAACA